MRVLPLFSFAANCKLRLGNLCGEMSVCLSINWNSLVIVGAVPVVADWCAARALNGIACCRRTLDQAHLGGEEVVKLQGVRKFVTFLTPPFSLVQVDES